MAYCPKCQGEMKTMDAVCPHCGHDFAEPISPADNPMRKQRGEPLADFTLLAGQIVAVLYCLRLIVEGLERLFGGRLDLFCVSAGTFVLMAALFIVMGRARRMLPPL